MNDDFIMHENQRILSLNWPILKCRNVNVVKFDVYMQCPGK